MSSLDFLVSVKRTETSSKQRACSSQGLLYRRIRLVILSHVVTTCAVVVPVSRAMRKTKCLIKDASLEALSDGLMRHSLVPTTPSRYLYDSERSNQLYT